MLTEAKLLGKHDFLGLTNPHVNLNGLLQLHNVSFFVKIFYNNTHQNYEKKEANAI